LAEDIDDALREREPNFKTLRERVAAAALKFEAVHPRFAGILSDITDRLASLGL
jgi:hypothetical protein